MLHRSLALFVCLQDFGLCHPDGRTILRATDNSIAIVSLEIWIKRDALNARPILIWRAHLGSGGQLSLC